VERNTYKLPSVFGVALCQQFSLAEQTAPSLLLRCTEEIELRAAADETLDLYTAYQASAPADQVNTLKQLFEEDMCTDLSGYDVNCLASIVKKYLRELPDPVIPVQFYSNFLDAAKIVNSEQCAKCMSTLVSQLPPQHRSTLAHLLAHFARLCTLQHQRGLKDPPTPLIYSLCHILLRPEWSKIIVIVRNTEHHIRIVELLLLQCNWGVTLPEFNTAPALPPRRSFSMSSGPRVLMSGPASESGVNHVRAGSIELTSPTSSTPPNVITLPQLDESDWYWGDISR
jgi:phosphoinositide-3-kinase regulatory subunit